jgi:hypothetical protein
MLRARVGELLGRESKAAASVPVRRWRELLSRPFIRPALAIGLTAALALLYFTRSAPEDLVDRSLANFKAVMDGSFMVQLASGEPAILRTFFAGKTQFPVIIPEMEDCTLLGGVLDDHAQGVFAHVLYDHHKHKIYLYQTGWEDALQGSGVTLTENVRHDLIARNRATVRTPEGYTIVLWRKGTTLCSAVSDLNEADLIMCLTSGDPDLLSE